MATTKINTPELFELESSTSGVRLPNGTTAERPSTANAGDFRFNTDDNKVEYYDGSNWFQIDDEFLPAIPSENFNAVLYAGNGSTQSITGVGFQPDLVWIKLRNTVSNHDLIDSVRGATKVIESDNTGAEFTEATNLTSFDSDGFTVGSTARVNKNNEPIVAWCWKAGGSAVSNTDGSITSSVSANQRAGFSILNWTGSTSTSAETVGHGLSSAPELVILKNRDASDSWYVFVNGVTSTSQNLKLNSTSGVSNTSAMWGGGMTPTVAGIRPGSFASSSSQKIIMYCFHSVAGYQKIGSYTGDGNSSGPIVNTGFEPAFVLIKNADGSDAWDDWYMSTNKTLTSGYLFANDSVAEQPYQAIRMLTNGFQVITNDTGVNQNGNTYIYLAIASDPTSTTPTLANSFKTNLYTGNGATQTIGGRLNGSAQFNGSNSQITIPSSVINPSSAYTISFFINFIDLGNEGIFTNASSTIRVGEIGVNLVNSTNLSVYSCGTGGSNILDILQGTPSSPFVANTWYHIAIISDRSLSNKGKIYINGTEPIYTFLSATASISLQSNVRLGFSDTRYLNGNIDQLRIYDSALSASQVNELYNETTATANTLNFPTGAGCVAAYPLDSNSNDLSGNYNGTDTSMTYSEGTSTNPSLVWTKPRSYADNNQLWDTIRGAGWTVYSNRTNAQNPTIRLDGVSSFNSNGFTIGNWNNINVSGETYVAWNWGSSTLPTINSQGTIPSLVSANDAAGFSIVKYKGEGAARTVGHGLTNPPEMVIIKNLDDTRNWIVYHTGLSSSSYITLNSTAAETTDTRTNGGQPRPFGPFNSTTFGVNIDNETGHTNNYIAYCWYSVPGYSKIGSYEGNNDSGDQSITELGFQPRFLLLKNVDDTGNWVIIDSARGNDEELYPNLSNEESNEPNRTTLDSDGFTVRNGRYNNNGDTFIYLAIA